MALLESSIDIRAMHEVTQTAIKFILNNSVGKVPIRRSDIVAHALNGNQKLFPWIFEIVQSNLNEIYGMELVEVPNTKSVKQYICVSTDSASSVHEYTPNQLSEITLLFVILSYIFMKGGTITESSLLTFLSRLKINADESHSYFGENINILISDIFPKQLYLKREQICTETSNNDGFELSWGFRSDLEFPKKEVLVEVANILNKPPICFVQQYREAYEDGTENVDIEIE